ncbi:MAG: flavin reductase family protein [Candidatus Marinimicrobia bacterium]|nr:flavin reductase family protein [Candidatus Neomarinimicrobiota bacterium]
MQILKSYRETRAVQYPEPVSIVIVKDKGSRYNPMSASWVTFTSIEPRMLVVSIGFERYTYELMQNQEEFVISIPSESMSAEVEFFGSNSGRDMDKLKELGTLTQPATVIDGVLLAEASVNYECRLTGTLKTGDHMIFAAEIVASHMHADLVPRLFMLGPKHFGGLGI